MGRLIETSETADKKGTGKSFAVTKMSYDKNGNPTKVVTPLGHEIRREYDLANRLMKESHIEKGGNIHNTTTFEYDKAGNIILATDLNGYSIRYQHDLLNREIRKTSKDGGITGRE